MMYMMQVTLCRPPTWSGSLSCLLQSLVAGSMRTSLGQYVVCPLWHPIHLLMYGMTPPKAKGSAARH